MNEQVEYTKDQVKNVEFEPTFVESPVQPNEKVRAEEIKISGDAVVTKVKELLRRGNIRCIIIKSSSGRTLVEIPLTIGMVGGVVGAVTFPLAAIIAAVGALAANLTIVIAKKD